uniref:Uncharacterized protein n=1 Tax=Picea glauca TaxID=3330 RepID=A0A101M013_PICGL|nr:hypothetical protein ABT39_MTgene4559 [Picea glauca]QHR87129.1 hypothetical protein Q903MT_gene1138 [Picea sitchensis]
MGAIGFYNQPTIEGKNGVLLLRSYAYEEQGKRNRCMNLPEYALSGPYTRVYLRVVLTDRIQFGINMIKKKKQVN